MLGSDETDEEFSQRFLALHTLSGSDTASRTYSKGKIEYFKIDFQCSSYCNTDCCRGRVTAPNSDAAAQH